VRNGSGSILSRLIWLQVLALAGLLAAGSVAAYLVINATANDFEDKLLQDHANEVSRYLTWRDGRWSLRLPPALQTYYKRASDGYALAVIDQDGRAIFSTYAKNQALPESVGDQPAPAFFRQRNGSFAGINFPVMKSGHTALIQVSQNLLNPEVIFDDIVALFLRRIAWIGIPIFALLLAADVLFLRRAMRPIIEASRAAAAIGPSRSHARLPTQSLPSEIQPLAQGVNRALERLEIGLQVQREFTADAAHELRTPLAVLRTHVETTLHGSQAGALLTDIDVMSHIVEQLLDLAELDSYSISQGEAVDLRSVCSEIVSMMAPVGLTLNRTVELAGGPGPVWTWGNSEMLFRAIRNLVENAIRYTASGSSVEVEVGPSAAISVKDRGPGVAACERELVFRRFWRRDRRDKEHSGLGLAIVARTAQIHGGTVEVNDRAGGGAVFTVVLPALDPARTPWMPYERGPS